MQEMAWLGGALAALLGQHCTALAPDRHAPAHDTSPRYEMGCTVSVAVDMEHSCATQWEVVLPARRGARGRAGADDSTGSAMARLGRNHYAQEHTNRSPCACAGTDAMAW